LVSPVTTALVGAGVPLTAVVGCATAPMYGVTTYVVTGPPVDGAVQFSAAEAIPAVPVTLDAAPGAGDGEKTTST